MVTREAFKVSKVLVTSCYDDVIKWYRDKQGRPVTHPDYDPRTLDVGLEKMLDKT